MLEYGLVTAKASRGMPGYDIIAHNLITNQHCKIQVKFRKAIDSDGARVSNLEFDFLAYVAGNKGYVGEKDDTLTCDFKECQVYIIPVDVVRKNVGKYGLFQSPTWGGYDQYLNDWRSILDFLGWDNKYNKRLL